MEPSYGVVGKVSVAYLLFSFERVACFLKEGLLRVGMFLSEPKQKILQLHLFAILLIKDVLVFSQRAHIISLEFSADSLAQFGRGIAIVQCNRKVALWVLGTKLPQQLQGYVVLGLVDVYHFGAFFPTIFVSGPNVVPPFLRLFLAGCPFLFVDGEVFCSFKKVATASQSGGSHNWN
jgi:hypothetical protein